MVILGGKEEEGKGKKEEDGKGKEEKKRAEENREGMDETYRKQVWCRRFLSSCSVRDRLGRGHRCRRGRRWCAVEGVRDLAFLVVRRGNLGKWIEGEVFQEREVNK